MRSIVRKTRDSLGRSIFWIGLLVILAYWFSVHTPGFSRGYGEDMGFFELTRQLMSESLTRQGKPVFTTDSFMTPMGASVPYMSWSVERDGIGGLFWSWNKDFPFSWAWFGVSLIATYLGVGYILGKMGLSRGARWSMSLLVVLFHVPRHFKIWHHYEHLLQHWIYLGFFLDAWLWQKFVRDREWSWQIELWRGVVMIGMLWTVGTFWGPMILEWVLVHGALLWVGLARLRRGEKTRIQSFGTRSEFLRRISPPLVIIAGMLIVDLWWFLPLAAEVKKLGTVFQGIGWHAPPQLVFRPLFWEAGVRAGWFPPVQPAFDGSETVITVGWTLWIPALAAMILIRKKRGGPGFVAIAPFVILMVIAILYAVLRKPTIYPQLIQAVIPFMSFFRVASRWGLFLPQMLVVLVVLAWPELSRAASRAWASPNRIRWKAAACLFFVIVGAEATWLTYPVNRSEPLSVPAVTMLDRIHKEPGSTVLDLPFCVAGGNGVCTGQQCPNYPASTLGQSLRQWHEKKVYGLYQSRMVDQHCRVYDRAPYVSWFDAWSRNRCFTDAEWGDFCSYLDAHPETSAVLLYADIWTAAGSAECLGQFAAHLGAPKDQVRISTESSRGSRETRSTRVYWFGARCLKPAQ